MDCAVDNSQGRLYVLENIVGGSVAAAAFAPSFNDSLIVSENLEMKVGGTIVEDSSYEELETNAFGPSDVTVAVVPARLKYPGPPVSIEINTDPGG